MSEKEYEKMAPALWELWEYKYCLVLEQLKNRKTRQGYFENLVFNFVP